MSRRVTTYTLERHPETPANVENAPHMWCVYVEGQPFVWYGRNEVSRAYGAARKIMDTNKYEYVDVVSVPERRFSDR